MLDRARSGANGKTGTSAPPAVGQDYKSVNAPAWEEFMETSAKVTFEADKNAPLQGHVRKSVPVNPQPAPAGPTGPNGDSARLVVETA